VPLEHQSRTDSRIEPPQIVWLADVQPYSQSGGMSHTRTSVVLPRALPPFASSHARTAIFDARGEGAVPTAADTVGYAFGTVCDDGNPSRWQPVNSPGAQRAFSLISSDTERCAVRPGVLAARSVSSHIFKFGAPSALDVPRVQPGRPDRSGTSHNHWFGWWRPERVVLKSRWRTRSAKRTRQMPKRTARPNFTRPAIPSCWRTGLPQRCAQILVPFGRWRRAWNIHCASD
jgi:hypothetical protein